MYKKSRFIIFLSITALIFGIFGQTAAAAAAGNNKYAETLNSLGLFLGTNKGYELESEVNRVQAAAMLVRLLGAEQQAQRSENRHPFTDVPSWANHYIAYMYSNNLTKGVSSSTFNPNGLCNLQMYSTFMLRALGYSEGSDFTYQTAVDTADKLGLLEEVNRDRFLRGDMVAVSYFALASKLKGSDNTLLDKLVANGAVSAEAAKPVQQLFAAGKETENKNDDVKEEPKNVHVKITIGDTVLTATMLDNAASRDFISMMPFTVTLSDYAGTEKISDLPKRLSTDDAPSGYDPSVGTIAYYAPWGNLAIYYNDFSYSSGLVPLGNIITGIEELKILDRDTSATFEIMN